jgi:hypothetical protein
LRAIDPLTDDRVNIVFNDARNALKLTSKSYDAIISQPSHPWTAAASHLYTLEFMELAKAHLNEDGVYLQWMDSTYVDSQLLRSLAATILDVFESARVYRVGARDLMFLASDGQLEVEQRLLQSGRPLSEQPLHFGNLGMNGPEDLIAMLALDENGMREFAEGAAPSTDDRNLMAMRSRYRGDGLTGPGLDALFEPYDPLLDRTSWIYRELGQRLDFVYLANRLMRFQQTGRVAGLTAAIRDESTRAVIAAEERRFLGDIEGAAEFLAQALQSEPGNVDARYARLALALPTIAQGNVPNELRPLTSNLPAAPRAVIRGWPLAAAQNWADLAQLDSDLGRSNVSDIWYPQTVQLRAEWRVRVANDARYPQQALQMIDRVLAINPDLNLFVLRAVAAIALKDDAAFIESNLRARIYMQEELRRAIDGDLQMSDDDARRSMQRIRALSAKLDELADAGSRRADQVSRSMDDLLQRYQAFVDSP